MSPCCTSRGPPRCGACSAERWQGEASAEVRGGQIIHAVPDMKSACVSVSGFRSDERTQLGQLIKQSGATVIDQ